MVRVNIINPKKLTDQHLVAEYLEIMMLMAYIRKHQLRNRNGKDIPKSYCLGKGHILFFKNKVSYLRKRHELLKKEMKTRGFATNKTLKLKGIAKSLKNDWQPCNKDFQVIKKRLKQKISLKPEWYRHYGKKRSKKFLLKLVS